MNKLYARLLLMGLVTSLSCPLLANQAAILPESPLVVLPVGNDKYFVDYQSKKLPNWNFSVQINRAYSERFASGIRPIPVIMIDVEELSVSARRALPVSTPHWIYASFRSTQYSGLPASQPIPLLGDSDNAASIGWQFGESTGFGMAVGYEYRYIGEEDINSLVMGVHYFF